jgi:hypothetical protein
MSASSRLLVWVLSALVAISGCAGEDPVPQPPIGRTDGSTSGDASGPGDDAAVAPDTGAPSDDATVAPDADPSTTDAAQPDTGPSGADAAADAGAPDAMVGPAPDGDADGISDADEGNGTVDTDGDGMADTTDADSDDDGIPDAAEAGDNSTSTPPVDTDGDGTPDFRDADSDDDGIPDLVEGQADPDGDGLPNARDTDSDGDGLPDLVEGTGDADMDGTSNALDTDSDGDGINDMIEGTGDPDGDALPSYLDADSDGDGLSDMLEGAADQDTDGLRNFLDLDADGDGISDMLEGAGDPDGDGLGSYLDVDADGDAIGDTAEGSADPDADGTPSYLDADSDGDGVTDSDEAGDTSLFTPAADSDFDGTPDYLDLDSDGDNIADLHEGTADTDGDLLLDRLDIDSDGDGLLDLVEAGDGDLATAPVDADVDGAANFRDNDSDNDLILDASEGVFDRDMDGLPNFVDTDADGDGVLDRDEAGDADLMTSPVNSDTDTTPNYLDTDSDDDGLADGTEAGCPAGSSRLLADSDGDTYLDPAELAFGSNPCNMGSVITGFYFVLPPLDPPQMAPLLFSDTDIDRADVAFDVDTTGSMGEEIANLRTSLSNTIIPGVRAQIADSAFGVAYFEDYPVTPFGDAASGDVPFRLLQRITTNAAAAQAGVNALVTRNGLDLPESGLEGLYQVATGAGTAWPGGSVAAFNPATNRVPGVADGDLGGVGFRQDAFPVVVHITDATAHQRADYQAVSAGITAADTPVVLNALDALGARVVGIANSRLPNDPHAPVCGHTSARITGNIRAPAGSDADWFELVGATAGQSVRVETFAARSGAALDTMVAVFNSSAQLALNDDISTTVFDSAATVTLSGAGPYYVAVTAYNDPDFNGSGGGSTGHYFLDVTVNGVAFTSQVTECRADDANARAGATRTVAFASSAGPASVAACLTTCDTILSRFTLPYGLAERTGAVIPTCAWDRFGAGRPAGCAANQCCTGVNGAGIAPNAAGLCPLSFQVQDNGAGLSGAVVSGIEALVRFSAFTVTTVVRPDPVEQAATGFDTTCFIHGVTPVSATPQACAPTPVIADLLPPAGINDSFQNVAPGTSLTFDVNAQNQNLANGAPCRPRAASPQLYRAYIDVVADGVTVVDTRDVIIIVPPQPPTGSN